MFGYGKLINIFAAIIIGIIGFLFTLKYSVVYNLGYLPPFIWLAGYLAVLTLLNTPNKITQILSKKYIIISTILVIGSLAYILFFPRIGNVNRIPAIVDWIQLYFKGEFPYNSGLTPSSFPFLFFLSMPFYFTGTLGLFEVFGLVIVLVMIYKTSTNQHDLAAKFILFLITPVLLYSFTVRCELIFNVSFLILAIYFAEKYVNEHKFNLNFILVALFFGLGLSIRSTAGIIYAIYLLYKFRNNLPKLIIFSAITISVLIAFLIPFILWDVQAFINNGPFAIQSQLSNIPTYVSVIFLLIAVVAGWMVADLQEVFFMSGLLLFLMVILSYVFKVYEFGFYTAFFEDKIDLSYLEFVLPLMIVSIKDYCVDRFLGKVYK